MAGAVRIYVRAFPASMRHFTGETHPPPEALGAPGPYEKLLHQRRWAGLRFLLEDFFHLWLLAEPAAFCVAADARGLLGYAFTPARLITPAGLLRHPQAWRIAGRLLRGGYGLGGRLLRLGIANGLHGLADGLRTGGGADCPARIASIAVDPGAQRLGVGRLLLTSALAYQRAQGARCVRLEVRPGNAAAIALYRSLGFAEAGTAHDTQGEWVVMVAELT